MAKKTNVWMIIILIIGLFFAVQYFKVPPMVVMEVCTYYEPSFDVFAITASGGWGISDANYTLIDSTTQTATFQVQVDPDGDPPDNTVLIEYGYLDYEFQTDSATCEAYLIGLLGTNNETIKQVIVFNDGLGNFGWCAPSNAILGYAITTSNQTIRDKWFNSFMSCGEVDQCTTDEDCTDTDYCVNGLCVNVPCPEGGNVTGHTCYVETGVEYVYENVTVTEEVEVSAPIEIGGFKFTKEIIYILIVVAGYLLYEREKKKGRKK